MIEVPKSLEEVFAKHGPVACKVHDARKSLAEGGGYTCYHCNKSFSYGDPDFVYYKLFGPNNWLVRAGIAREGDRQCLIWVDPQPRGKSNRVSGGFETFGWFAHCADEEACAKRKRNVSAGVHPEHERMEVS